MGLKTDEILLRAVVHQIKLLDVLGAVLEGLILFLYVRFERVGDRAERSLSDLYCVW